MAILEDTTSRRQHVLSAQTLIGRSRTCNLLLETRGLSGQHALLRWTGEAWELRDLGSLNGTFLNGRRLPPGERVTLASGDRLGLGRDDERWLIRNVGAPYATAVPDDASEPVVAVGGMLSLPPDIEPPEIVVYRDPSGMWVMEKGDETEPISTEVEAGGRRWSLTLPEPIEETIESSTLKLHAISLRFEVSQDEEYACMTVMHNQKALTLEARVHHYLLLTLARVRLREQAADPDNPDSHGWVHQDDLERMLRMKKAQVNLQIFRARKQLVEAGVHEAAGIIERRPSSRQLRIGVAQVDIETI